MNEYKILNICKYACLASLCGFIGSLFIQMHVSNAVSLKGKDFRELHARMQTLEKEIAYLQFEESTLSSLTNVEERARALGFVDQIEPLALISSPSLASLYSR